MKRRENNTGTIYRQKGARSKPYIVRVATGEKGMTPSGRVYYKTTTIGCYSTYDEAEYALAVYKKDPTQTKEGYFTVNDVWEQYEKAMESRLAPVTLKMYQSAYKKLKPIADRNIAKLEVQECQQLLDGIESRPRYSSATFWTTAPS